MPDEICVSDRQFGDAAFDVLERCLYLIQAHSGLVAEMREFIAIIAADIVYLETLKTNWGEVSMAIIVGCAAA